MCVLAFAWRAHPRWQLVVAANRDELHSRPSTALSIWNEPSGLIAGRDLVSGGTWLGLTETGRFAAVTNLRGFGPPDPTAASRGGLVTDLLVEPYQHLPIQIDCKAFNPFNAVAVDGSEAWLLSNRPSPASRPLSPGVYGMSNGPLDEPWPKTVWLKERLANWITADSHAESLLSALRDNSPVVGRSEHPPIFVLDDVYGTRCSTVVAIGADGRGFIIERSYDAAGEAIHEVALSFAWPPGAGLSA